MAFYRPDTRIGSAVHAVYHHPFGRYDRSARSTVFHFAAFPGAPARL